MGFEFDQSSILTRLPASTCDISALTSQYASGTYSLSVSIPVVSTVGWDMEITAADDRLLRSVGNVAIIPETGLIAAEKAKEVLVKTWRPVGRVDIYISVEHAAGQSKEDAIVVSEEFREPFSRTISALAEHDMAKVGLTSGNERWSGDSPLIEFAMYLFNSGSFEDVNNYLQVEKYDQIALHQFQGRLELIRLSHLLELLAHGL